MNRTALFAALGVAAIALSALGLVLTRKAEAPPNVLILLWDTVRADRMSLYGHDLPTTPRIDAWATRSGVVYEQAVSPDMWTVPSHASLFTGLPPGTHGAGFDHRWLDDHRTTLAEHFGANGWDTFAFSANPNLSTKRVNLLQGFETVETSWSRRWRREVIAHTQQKLIQRDRSTEISPSNPGKNKGTGFYNAGPVAHQAFVDWLDTRENRDKPFLAYLSYMEAHKPRVPDVTSRRKVTNDDTIRVGLDTDLTFRNQLLFSYGKLEYTPEELEAINRVYDATLIELDNATADLLDDLEARGVLDNTIVVLTADHGEQLGEHGQFGHRSGVYQALLHVPLVIAYPKKLAAKRVETPVSNLEIFSTLVTLAGIEEPDSGYVRGNLSKVKDQLQAVFAETLSVDRLGFGKVKKLHPDLERDVFANTYRAVVLGDYKLIQTVAFDSHDVVDCELYHIGDDPSETIDLFDAKTEVALDLAKQANAWKAAQEPWKADQADVVEENLSDAEKRQLELLGYVTEEEEGDEEVLAVGLTGGNRCQAQ